MAGPRPNLRKPYSLDMLGKLNATYQRMKREVIENKDPKKLSKMPKCYNQPLFSRHSPEVQALAYKHLNILCQRHKAKLEADRRHYYCILVATAARLAMAEVGLINKEERSRKAGKKNRVMRRLRAALMCAKVPNVDGPPPQVNADLEGVFNGS